MADEKKQKVQRIAMRLYGSPVRHEGDLVEFAPDGSEMVVDFDGPMGQTKFWRGQKALKALFTDKPPKNPGDSYQDYPDGTHLWEVV